MKKLRSRQRWDKHIIYKVRGGDLKGLWKLRCPTGPPLFSLRMQTLINTGCQNHEQKP